VAKSYAKRGEAMRRNNGLSDHPSNLISFLLSNPRSRRVLTLSTAKQTTPVSERDASPKCVIFAMARALLAAGELPRIYLPRKRETFTDARGRPCLAGCFPKVLPG